MRAIEFNLKDPTFGAELVEVDEPELPNGEWARVAVTVGGICGSDLHLFGNRPMQAPALGGFWTFPFLLGHEIAGRVVEAGPGCEVPVGTRVAVDPAIPCAARGIDPVCRLCAAGHASCCLNLGSGITTPGMSIGFTVGLGGGWADQVLAHRSMLHPIPDGSPTRSRACTSRSRLRCTVSCASHHETETGSWWWARASSVSPRSRPCAGCSRRARSRPPRGTRTRPTRPVRPARTMSSAPGDDDDHFDELAALAGGVVTGRGRNRMLLGGFPYVIEAVGGLESVTESLRLVDHRGTVLFIGTGGWGEVDLSPLWFKEAELVGAWNHSPGVHPTRGAGHSIDFALDVLARGGLPESVVTHRFALEDLRDAVATAIDKRDARAIKVVFEPVR